MSFTQKEKQQLLGLITTELYDHPRHLELTQFLRETVNSEEYYKRKHANLTYYLLAVRRRKIFNNFKMEIETVLTANPPLFDDVGMQY